MGKWWCSKSATMALVSPKKISPGSLSDFIKLTGQDQAEERGWVFRSAGTSSKPTAEKSGRRALKNLEPTFSFQYRWCILNTRINRSFTIRQRDLNQLFERGSHADDIVKMVEEPLFHISRAKLAWVELIYNLKTSLVTLEA